MFEINQILEEILPNKFQNIKDLSTQEIIKTYLDWYFDRRFKSDLKQLLNENQRVFLNQSNSFIKFTVLHSHKFKTYPNVKNCKTYWSN